MSFEQCNERFYLMADLHTALGQRRLSLQVQLDAVRPAATDADGSDGDDDATADAASSNATLADKLDDALAELDEREEELALCDNHLDLYCRHLLRKALSSTVTFELLEELKRDSTRVHLIADYKQKVLPEAARETQTMAFGKRGLSLHGTTVIRWHQPSEDFKVINVRVACDDSNQTWFHTLNALKVTVDTVKETWSDVKSGTLQSDGAGNYDCTAFMLSLERLFRAAGICLRRHVITEVGDGKNLTDTDFQQAQMLLNHAKDGGMSYADAQGILNALEANKTMGVHNVGMKLGTRALEPKSGQGPKSYKGIDAFYDRVNLPCTGTLTQLLPPALPPSPPRVLSFLDRSTNTMVSDSLEYGCVNFSGSVKGDWSPRLDCRACGRSCLMQRRSIQNGCCQVADKLALFSQS
jgi:hypothetical protein